MADAQKIYRSQSIEQSLTPLETPLEDTTARKVLHPWPEPETTLLPPSEGKQAAAQVQKSTKKISTFHIKKYFYSMQQRRYMLIRENNRYQNWKMIEKCSLQWT